MGQPNFAAVAAESSEIENEIPIPQESSIAGNISIQHQRRATGAAGTMVHAPQIRHGSTQFQIGGILGQSKSSPSLNALNTRPDNTGDPSGSGHAKRLNQNNDQQLQLAKGNQNQAQHPAMVGSMSSLF